MGWVVRGSRRYFYQTYWDKELQKPRTRYVPLAQAEAAAAILADRARRRALRREAKAAWAAALARQRQGLR